MDRLIGKNRKKRIGELLLEEGAITSEDLENALIAQKGERHGEKLGTILIDMGFITAEKTAQALAHQLNYELVQLSLIRVPEEIINLMNEEQLRKYDAVPFAFSEKSPNVLKIAMADPLDIRAIDDMSLVTGLQIEVCVTTLTDVSAAIDKYYGGQESRKTAQQFAKEREEILKERGAFAQDEEEDSDINEAPIVKLVRQMIEQAVHKRASDIHIEPLDNCLRIRFRIDGVLQEEMCHDIAIHPAMIARIKIISDLDISEKRKPQDGRATMVVDKQEYDIRVSLLPTVYGEKVVMRLTHKSALSREKAQLGLAPDDLEKFDKILAHPNGIILVTGPTGSGKSTTLYTALSELNVEGVNIITVEDPVEANIHGINQVQVNEKAGLTFASALRSILRQDPDIIMIGEIRDQETAEIAVKASITGHLVVSTLHTNSSASTITRLADMGVENYLIADSVVGVIAQRLVRRVCPECGLEYEPDLVERKILGLDPLKKVTIKKANHCDCIRCGGTGYYGRIGVYEIMPVGGKLKRTIASGGSIEEIEGTALKEGMKTLRQASVNYVLEGITTVDEVRRITCDDE